MLKIIALNGPPRSGKDTAFSALKIWPQNKFHRVQRFSFADVLKKGAHTLFGFGDKAPDYYDPVKDEPNKLFNNFTPREVYIDLGMYMRDHFDPQIFAVALSHQIKDAAAVHDRLLAVVTDCGFQNELAILQGTFGDENVLLMKTFRSGYDFEKDSRDYVDAGQCKEVEVHNNCELVSYMEQVQQLTMDWVEDTTCLKK